MESMFARHAGTYMTRKREIRTEA